MNGLELIPEEDIVKKEKKSINSVVTERIRRERSKELKDKNYAEYKKVMMRLEHPRFYENPSCPQYLGIHIAKYVQMIFDAQIFGKEKNGPIYWIIDWKGEKLKVKYVSSCLLWKGDMIDDL